MKCVLKIEKLPSREVSGWAVHYSPGLKKGKEGGKEGGSEIAQKAFGINNGLFAKKFSDLGGSADFWFLVLSAGYG